MKRELDVIDVNEMRKREVNRTTVEKSKKQKPKELSVEEKKRRRRRQRARELARKRRKRQRQLLCFLFIILAGTGMIFAGSKLDLLQKAKQAFAENGGGGISFMTDTYQSKKNFLYEVEYEEFLKENPPQVFSDAEVYARLKELAKEYKELESIYENCNAYPVKLLAALCNNPEMHEYVKGYLLYQAGDTSVAGKAELTKAEKEQKYPLFLQWDKRWGYEEYGDFNIALSGCGPTTLAMAAVALTGDTTITPDKVADYSMKNGYYVKGTGTAWSLMADGCENFGIKAEEISLDEQVMKNQLDAGKVIICSVREGDFTSLGHFILIYDYDEEGFRVNDPNCIYRSSISWTYEELKNQIRILWAFEEK